VSEGWLLAARGGGDHAELGFGGAGCVASRQVTGQQCPLVHPRGSGAEGRRQGQVSGVCLCVLFLGRGGGVCFLGGGLCAPFGGDSVVVDHHHTNSTNNINGSSYFACVARTTMAEVCAVSPCV
jgi:hypothetical protein